MRPGQTAPECGQIRQPVGFPNLGFNEAGADCPGMPWLYLNGGNTKARASMRPGQTAPECLARAWRSATPGYLLQ